MRGQISLEYLFISLISLCLVSLSVISLISIKDYAFESIEFIKFKSSASLLHISSKELCFMGNGNAKFIYFPHNISATSFKSDSWLVRFSDKNLSMVMESFCPIEGQASGETQIRNENGIIRLQ